LKILRLAVVDSQELIVQVHLRQEDVIVLDIVHAANVKVEQVQRVPIQEVMIVREIVRIRIAVEVDHLVKREYVLQSVGVD
jgi:hypothetical protein